MGGKEAQGQKTVQMRLLVRRLLYSRTPSYKCLQKGCCTVVHLPSNVYKFPVPTSIYIVLHLPTFLQEDAGFNGSYKCLQNEIIHRSFSSENQLTPKQYKFLNFLSLINSDCLVPVTFYVGQLPHVPVPISGTSSGRQQLCLRRRQYLVQVCTLNHCVLRGLDRREFVCRTLLDKYKQKMLKKGIQNYKSTSTCTSSSTRRLNYTQASLRIFVILRNSQNSYFRDKTNR